MDWLFDVHPDFRLPFFALFVFVAIIQLFYYWYYYSRLAFYKAINKRGYHLPVSVVLCARNECHNLEKNLPVILNQDYHDFEVVVVDDNSDDDTAVFLQQLELRYKNLKVITLKESVNFFKGKKLPLSVGIKSARHELILLTDADCKPTGPHWITRIADNFEGNVEIVLGYGGFQVRRGLLNKLIRFDTLFIAMQYFSMALAGKPYMGTGKNLAYKKELFFRAKGFTSHYKIPQGDDDLFVNQVATKSNVSIEISPHTHTFSTARHSFSAWLQEKKRRYTTKGYYKKRHKRMLSLFALSQFFFYPSLIASIVLYGLSLPALISAFLFLLRLVTLLVVFSRITKKFNERSLFPYVFLFEMIYPFINFIFVVASMFYTRQTWK